MLHQNGAQLASRSLRNVESVAARGFFEVLWRWSRVGCQGPRKGRSHATKPLLANQCYRASLPRATSRFPNSQITSLTCQQRSNSSTSTFAVPAEKLSDLVIEGSETLIAGEPKTPLFNTFAKTTSPSNPSADTPDAQSSSTKETETFETPVAEEIEAPLFNPFPKSPSSNAATDTSGAQSSATAEPKTEKEPEPPLSHDLRTIMRTLSSSVVVLTTTTCMPQPKDEATSLSPFKQKYKTSRGMTLSSFASLTLSPEPVVTFNIRSPSSTLEAIATCKHFLIHILDASPDGARIADVFTKGNRGKRTSENYTHGGVFRDGVNDKAFIVERELVSFQWREKEAHLELPRLRGTGVGKVLKCQLLEGVRGDSGKPIVSPYGVMRPTKGLIGVGDHVLVLGRVMEILDLYTEEDGETQYGLSYVDGMYRQVGNAISLKDEWPVEVEKGKPS